METIAKSNDFEVSENPKNEVVDETKEEEQKPVEVRLVDVPISNENMALNVLVSFVQLAHTKGVYSMEESSKIWECIRLFQKKE
tara:strand:- start:474 stop:725 length:252 start_codon:yes stop_codon:yes gene_type:complete